MNELIKKAMHDNIILSVEEAENAINFVSDMLEIDIEYTQTNEPYATRSISDMKLAFHKVRELTDMLTNL